MAQETQPPYAPPRASLELPAAPGVPPIEFVRAIQLLWVSFGFGLIDSILMVTVQSERYGGASTIIIALVTTTLSLYLIVSIAKRKSWARTLSLVGLVLGVPLYFLVVLQEPDPWWSVAVVTSSCVTSAMGVYLLYTGEGARWFKGDG